MLRLAMIDKMQITPIDFKSPRNKLKGTQSSDDIESDFPLISTKYNEYTCISCFYFCQLLKYLNAVFVKYT